MLISHQHRFIFVHIYKNAGSSIVTALLPYATYNRSHLWLVKLVSRIKRAPLPLPGVLNPSPMHYHASAQEVANRLGRELYDRYFSFAVVRNPWDWQVSLYHYALKHPTHHQHEFIKSLGDFSEYIRWRCSQERRLQKGFIYSQNGNPLVNFIGRYENLEVDFRKICERIGIRVPPLPRLNVSRSRPYQEYYTPETIDLVRKAFVEDIETFGYDFQT